MGFMPDGERAGIMQHQKIGFFSFPDFKLYRGMLVKCFKVLNKKGLQRLLPFPKASKHKIFFYPSELPLSHCWEMLAALLCVVATPHR